MKRTATTLLMLFSGTLAYCQSALPEVVPTVTVCLFAGSAAGPAVIRAQMLASRMFAHIGIAVNWQSESRTCPAQGTRVELSATTPEILAPGAFAYALPYEGTRVEVFYDRIHAEFGTLTSVVLAHVLVHEITHILQGVARHSARGVMKPKWDNADFARMMNKPLPFAPEDVQLIYLGLAARRHVRLVAMTKDQNVATIR
ncbi:MAG TPA: hypothetical protein VFA65_24110 [Bryobacteraceae bacterium]|nr:hypothetical protein [Bryobacteraceae bacterium]